MDRFQHADDVAAHLHEVITSDTDPLLVMKYVGFVSVAGVTVYELAIKDILIEFARRRHTLFGDYVASALERKNGRIRIDSIKADVEKFGSTFKERFSEELEETSRRYLRGSRQDIRMCYGNLITWRHEFAHQGEIRQTSATFPEVTQSYEAGKQVIHCLDRVLGSGG